MAHKRIQIIPFKRKRKSITNYSKRISLLLSKKKRMVVRKSLKNIIIQFCDYDPKGDKIILTVNSAELKKTGWNYQTDSIPAAYLTGLMAGKRALKAGIKEAVLDIGLYPSNKGSKLYAALKGSIDTGLKIPCNDKMFPSEDRINGGHIKKYAENVQATDLQFSEYRKKNIKPENITNVFDEVKKKIMST